MLRNLSSRIINTTINAFSGPLYVLNTAHRSLASLVRPRSATFGAQASSAFGAFATYESARLLSLKASSLQLGVKSAISVSRSPISVTSSPVSNETTSSSLAYCALKPRMASSSSSSSTAAHPFTNRLAKEKSPYLLQHAHNPVDWFPWSEEALETARRENKPIFLSVGYSTCHWCHVMEAESFESPAIAEVMNKYFVNVKVDREEYPAVDKFYMTFVQATTGSGGWPMSVWLTPDLMPFFGGTYFPATDSSYGQPSFLHVLNHLGKMWETEQQKIVDSGVDIVGLLRRNSESKAVEQFLPGAAGGMAEKLADWMERGFDEKWGGFARAPKFPTPAQLAFLAKAVSRGQAWKAVLESDDNDAKIKALANRLAYSEGDVEEELGKRVELAENAAHWLRFTLEKITVGGIHDHVGTGFARYSVDAEWHVPHFEKMLYDQGQLASLYAIAHLLTAESGTPPELDFSLVADDILSYLETNLTSPKGGFFCAEDADSYPLDNPKKKREGAFCVWTEKEIREALVQQGGMSIKDLEVFEYYFDVKPGGNVRPGPTDPHGELKGQNVLRVLRTVAEVATKFSISEEAVRKIIAGGKTKLAEIRKARPPPHLDDKILVAWNGLAISGLATCHTLLKPTESTSRFLEKAIAATDFIRGAMYDEESGQLRRVYRDDGPGASRGVAEDYAFLIQGLLDLYEALVLSGASAEKATPYLEWACKLQDYLDAQFWDFVGWAYFTGAKNPTPERKIGEAEDFVLLRTKEDHDGAEPAASSIALSNLTRLEGMVPKRATGMPYGERATCVASAFAAQLAKFPQTMPAMVAAVEDWRYGLDNIVVRDASKEALTELRKSKILARTVTLADEFTSKYNDKVADALAGEKTGVFGTKL